MLVLAVGAHAVLDEAEDLGRRHQHYVHDDDGDQNGRDAMVRVDVRRRDSVATPETRRLPQRLHQPHIAEGQHGERQSDPEREVEPVVDDVRTHPHHDVVVPEVHLATVSARHSLDLELQQSRDVEDNTHSRDESDRRLHSDHSDDVARLERVTDGQVASHRHDDRQPRAHLDERVDEGATVRPVDQLETDAPIGESGNRESYLIMSNNTILPGSISYNGKVMCHTKYW